MCDVFAQPIKEIIYIMLRVITVILLTGVFLSACSTAPKGPQHAVNLTAQLEKVAEIQRWQMRGKIAFKQGNEAVSLNLVWKNDSGDFDFRLSNFLGVSMVDLNVTSEQSTLVVDGETYYDAEPESLIYNTTGIIIPVAPLLSWVKGLPLKDDTFTLTDKGLVDTLQSGCNGCSNWTVRYGQYGKVDSSVWLPHSITLTQLPMQQAFAQEQDSSNTQPDASLTPQTQLKIKIYKWTTL